jgi:hypothetical protein
MKAIIVQAQGYYGVNIRLVADNDTRLKSIRDGTYRVKMPMGIFINVDLRVVDVNIIQPIGMEFTQSFGFDTGAWDEGEKLIAAALAGTVKSPEIMGEVE